MDAGRSYASKKGMESAGSRSSNFEVIDGLLYRKKFEKGFIHYREVLGEDRRQEAISTFHRRRPGQRHLSLEETYKCVAENYWWEGMYFQIRDFVLHCPQCKSLHSKTLAGFDGRRCVSKTVPSHGADLLSKLRSQREAGLFCDITLRTNGGSFSAHRAVLAAVSDHFHEVLAEMDSSKMADIDLSGFSEDSLLSLLDFSYSSTLRVHQENLPEVCAMARHLGMWPAVEACAALLKEQEQQLHLPGKAFSSARSNSFSQSPHQQREGLLKLENMNEGFSLVLETSDESLSESPKRNLRRTPKPQAENGLPLSPSHRMKLMDFKSPSSKKASTPRHGIGASRSQSYSPVSVSTPRLLRSSPGAAKEVQRFLPKPEMPQKNRKSYSMSSRSRQGTSCSPVRVKQEAEEVGEDEEDYARAQEKYKLMNVLGLQRTALLPRPEDLIGWRQKKRLRKLKANNYSLTKRREPRPSPPRTSYEDVKLSLPLCNPVNTQLLKKSVKSKGLGSIQKISAKRMQSLQQLIPPTDRSMRSKGVLPDLFQWTSVPVFGGRELRRSVRKGDAAQQPLHYRKKKSLARNVVKVKAETTECSISGLRHSSQSGHTSPSPLPSQRTQTRQKVAADAVKSLRYNSSRPAAKAKLKRASMKEGGGAKGKVREEARPKGKVSEPNGLPEHPPQPSLYSHPLYKAIKEEPAEPVPVGPFPDPPSPDLGKRQSKPPIKLLDSGFLFSFCRPVGGSGTGVKKEEESVAICLTRSVSQVPAKFEAEGRALRARGPTGLCLGRREERRAGHGRLLRHRPKSKETGTHLDKCAGSITPKKTAKVNSSNHD
ncbi:zinc finger and BTB domain-containing protein 11 [Cyprinodon tularosa]|uniref:zinc finger and BTB domain-containing protein 11 n=1 Tax=Cyprinodon tularosa TaxID=77115 RepID=UPI0018E21667|nr:zinc finger and BTB domain-containing protein 11 [Cyprinodon tularosa]